MERQVKERKRGREVRQCRVLWFVSKVDVFVF